MVKATGKNRFSQLLALREYYLPGEPDTLDNLAKAQWLDDHHAETLALAVNKGINMCFKR